MAKVDAFVGASALTLMAALLGASVHLDRKATLLEAAVEDMSTPQGSPKFIGYGCEGTSAAIWANDEDSFPKCGAIERVQ